MNTKTVILDIAEYVCPDPKILLAINQNFFVTTSLHNADYVLRMSGDGGMLDCFRRFRTLFDPAAEKPIFTGLNYGHLGFFMNEPSVQVIQELSLGLIEVIEANLLKAEIEFEDGRHMTDLAVNDFYFRTPEGTAKVRVVIDGDVVRPRLVCDGIIVATAFGSTAYSGSCQGIVLPFGARNQMVLTAIAPSLAANWRNVPLEDPQVVTLEVFETDRNPVNFYADGIVYKNVRKATICFSDKSVRIAFAESQRIRQRQLRLQLFPETVQR